MIIKDKNLFFSSCNALSDNSIKGIEKSLISNKGRSSAVDFNQYIQAYSSFIEKKASKEVEGAYPKYRNRNLGINALKQISKLPSTPSLSEIRLSMIAPTVKGAVSAITALTVLALGAFIYQTLPFSSSISPNKDTSSAAPLPQKKSMLSIILDSSRQAFNNSARAMHIEATSVPLSSLSNAQSATGHLASNMLGQEALTSNHGISLTTSLPGETSTFSIILDFLKQESKNTADATHIRSSSALFDDQDATGHAVNDTSKQGTSLDQGSFLVKPLLGKTSTFSIILDFLKQESKNTADATHIRSSSALFDDQDATGHAVNDTLGQGTSLDQGSFLVKPLPGKTSTFSIILDFLKQESKNTADATHIRSSSALFDDQDATGHAVNDTSKQGSVGSDNEGIPLTVLSRKEASLFSRIQGGLTLSYRLFLSGRDAILSIEAALPSRQTSKFPILDLFWWASKNTADATPIGLDSSLSNSQVATSRPVDDTLGQRASTSSQYWSDGLTQYYQFIPSGRDAMFVMGGSLATLIPMALRSFPSLFGGHRQLTRGSSGAAALVAHDLTAGAADQMEQVAGALTSEGADRMQGVAGALTSAATSVMQRTADTLTGEGTYQMQGVAGALTGAARSVMQRAADTLTSAATSVMERTADTLTSAATSVMERTAERIAEESMKRFMVDATAEFERLAVNLSDEIIRRVTQEIEKVGSSVSTGLVAAVGASDQREANMIKTLERAVERLVRDHLRNHGAQSRY